MDPRGFEPRASSLQRRHSTTELWAQLNRDGPLTNVADSRNRSPDGSKVPGRRRRPNPRRWARAKLWSRSLGGDPAADSPTATLLRLNPPCGAQIRLSHDSLIRTPLGCFDGRCVQGAGTYSPRASDTRLLPNPASCGRVSVRNPNYDQV